MTDTDIFSSSYRQQWWRGFRKAGTINETAVNNQIEDRYLGHQLPQQLFQSEKKLSGSTQKYETSNDGSGEPSLTSFRLN